MEKYSNIVVVGLGKSGFSVVDFFSKQDVKIKVFDSNSDHDEIKISKLKDMKNIELNLGKNPTGYEDADIVVMSPGIPLELDFVANFRSRGIEITGDIELAYRLGKGTYIGITGTNGKTTTTTLVGEICKNFQENTYVVGNIGTPVLDKAVMADEHTFMVTELSSFQLESIYDFRPHISALLNITEDHLNRHKTMESYIAAKFRIFENQKEDDFLVLNYDDKRLRLNQDNIAPKIIFFSRKEKVDYGVYVDGDYIVSNINGSESKILNLNLVKLLGNHNIENILAATAISILAGVDEKTIKDTIIDFNGVEHRLELVMDTGEVRYINDSKGTNPDSSIKALEAVPSPIILIAGGMDKKSDFTEFIDSFNGKVYHLILLGETKDIIENTAKLKGFDSITKVNSMEEAVKFAKTIARPKDTVLLSPACASWDMYSSYEERGWDFKNWVNTL